MSDLDKYLNKYTEYVDKVADFIPYKGTKVWREFFFNPTKTVTGNIGGIGNRVKDLYVMQVIGLVIGLLALIPYVLIYGATLVSNPIAGGFGIGLIVGLMVLFFILGPIISLLYSMIEYAVAKILGGKAEATAHVNASILPTLATFLIVLPLSILIIPIRWLAIIPLVNCCVAIITLPVSLVTMFVNLYGIYLKYLAFKEVHKLTAIRTIAVIFAPIIILIGLIIAAYFVFAAAIIGGGLGSSLLQSGALTG
ncbi:hypothetical protein KKE92_03280 [Candidatus Micrarchaeota archaeon]|nr:hypothetical protein [Candidatus Micrarchaeota archaeon]MBU1681652.1 hypothetical protein [Candidatus Micrarchaeota archaeon]